MPITNGKFNGFFDRDSGQIDLDACAKTGNAEVIVYHDVDPLIIAKLPPCVKKIHIFCSMPMSHLRLIDKLSHVKKILLLGDLNAEFINQLPPRFRKEHIETYYLPESWTQDVTNAMNKRILSVTQTYKRPKSMHDRVVNKRAAVVPPIKNTDLSSSPVLVQSSLTHAQDSSKQPSSKYQSASSRVRIYVTSAANPDSAVYSLPPSRFFHVPLRFYPVPSIAMPLSTLATAPQSNVHGAQLRMVEPPKEWSSVGQQRVFIHTTPDELKGIAVLDNLMAVNDSSDDNSTNTSSNMYVELPPNKRITIESLLNPATPPAEVEKPGSSMRY